MIYAPRLTVELRARVSALAGGLLEHRDLIGEEETNSKVIGRVFMSFCDQRDFKPYELNGAMNFIKSNAMEHPIDILRIPKSRFRWLIDWPNIERWARGEFL